MITRKLYKDVKKYDHKQMNDFLEKIYKSGYQDAVNKLSEERMKDIQRTEFDPEELKVKLMCIKGMGELRSQQIVNVISEYFNSSSETA